MDIYKKDDCRVCKKKVLIRVFSFGPTPLANAFLNKNQIDKGELFYPLDVYICQNCYFMQLGHVINSRLLFDDYVYVSSTSKVFVNHFNNFAKDIISKFKLDSNSLVVDIGSNDGILLLPYEELNINVLGIEPAKHIADIAIKKGIPTIKEYFTNTVASEVVKKRGKAQVVTATNVFAHIDDIDEITRGVKTLLDKDGIFIVEAPYLIDFFEKKYFDLVYHEHMSYWSVSPMIDFFKRFDMTVFDVQKVSSHGGSMRVFIKKNEGKHEIQKSVKQFVDNERQKGLNKLNTYFDFADAVLQNKVSLTKLLAQLKSKSKKIVGYGAPAKGNTMLNYFKIGNDILDYIIDDSPLKQGLFTPGTRIPVYSPKHLQKEKPDYIFILAWNFAESIMSKYSYLTKDGVKFIVPVPKPRIITR